MASIRAGEFTTKEKIQYGLLGIVVLGGAFILVRNLVRQTRSNLEERLTLDDGNAATFAKQLKMAFENDGWPGTDENAIREVLRRIASKEDFKAVIDSYQRLYNESLLRDMKDELTTSEYDEMLSIISAKPDRYSGPQALSAQQYQAWARRLKAAFDWSYGLFPGTDEEAIKAVFLEIPSQAAFQQVATVYRAEFGNDLVSDLKSELEFWEYGSMMKIITDKP
ncbi:MAG: hypothetical protein J7621_22385 [Niastella sp.]|nr:hypothetical protein [Niastella sp.]